MKTNEKGKLTFCCALRKGSVWQKMSECTPGSKYKSN